MKSIAACFLRIALLFFSALTIQSCGLAHRIHTVQEQGTDFSQYRTYGFVASLKPDGQGYTGIHEKYIRTAIVAELEKRGFEVAEKPDVWVNFYVVDKDKFDTDAHSSLSLGYSGYVGSCTYSNSAAHNLGACVSRYTERTLTIDIVDRQRRQVVWQGTAVGRKKAKPPKDWQEKVAELVSLIFRTYPGAAQ